MQKIRVQNMTSPRSGSAVANQFIITTPEGRYFQSYESTIAYIPFGHGAYDQNGVTKIVLDESTYQYSVTTSKYLYKFLGLTRKEIAAQIKDGTILLGHLNA